ncbi:cupin domain-containing protein [Natrononativus amylolyticus]|uniref:cupin domain-containing protein n=1 Tax=Natrononativus amylolyticus TaxID=2963434 RepID=UPI0020CE9705|nr:cupin domain-containing protein [Natrononativus amylolyticus]
MPSKRYSKISLTEVEGRTKNSSVPMVKSLGYELRARGDPRPRELRFNYFYYETGQAVPRHTQQKQEEVFFIVEGRCRVEVDGEEFEVEAGDVVVIDPGPWRQITALEPAEIFAIGAPNVRDDAVFEDQTGAD